MYLHNQTYRTLKWCAPVRCLNTKISNHPLLQNIVHQETYVYDLFEKSHSCEFL